MKRLFLFLLLSCVTSYADKYLRQGATGSGNGSDWTNAYTTLSALESGLTRGETGYVADTTTGLSGDITWDTAVSGTTLITVQKATVASHGTATGWSDTYGDGQAVISGMMMIKTNYLTFDGVTGNGASVSPPDTTPGNYGFYFSHTTNPFVMGNTVGPSYQNITVRHVYAQATTNDTEKIFIQGGFQITQADNVTVSYCLLDGWQNGFMARGQSSQSYDGCVWEYNICLNGFSSDPNNHGEWLNPNSRSFNGLIVRYNIFKGRSGNAGQTGTIVANNSSNNNLQVYGNIFDGLRYGNGCITGTSAGSMSNAVVYNNTFLNASSDSGEYLDGPGSSNTARNNLVYNMFAGINGDGSSWNSNYGAYFSTTGSPSEANKQSGTGNPFTNSAASIYTLVTNTTAGTNLGAPYNVDMLGRPRTTWSRGALEFGSAPSDPLPTVQSAVINALGTQILLTFSEAVTVGGGGSGGFALTIGGSSVALGSPSGAGTTRNYPITGRVIGSGETGTLAYTQPGNGYEDSALQDMLSFTGASSLSVTNNSTVPTVSAPVFSPVQGPYFDQQSITMTSSTPGAVIRYTTNGTDPTASSTQYVSAIPTSASANYKAKAFASGFLDSGITSASYEIGTWVSGAAWKNVVVPQQTGTFTWTFRASASSTTSGGIIGLSPTPSAAQNDLAHIARFGPTGTIQARNNTAFAAVNNFSYVAGTTYEFVFNINLAASTYSMTVAQIGGAPVTIANNYTNNATAIGISDVDNVGISVPASGTMTVSQMSFGGVTTIPSLTSATIGANGTTLTLVFSEPVVYGTGGNGGWTMSASGGAVTLTPTVNPTTFTTSRAISMGETGTISYIQPGNGVEASTGGGDLASRSAFAFNNQSTVDLTAPTPSPMSFSVQPAAVSSFSVTMTASVATDANSPPVQYYFDETSANPGGVDSGWQSSRTYTNSGLTPGIQYTYRVLARDSSTGLNQTTPSSSFNVTTPIVAGGKIITPAKEVGAGFLNP